MVLRTSGDSCAFWALMKGILDYIFSRVLIHKVKRAKVIFWGDVCIIVSIACFFMFCSEVLWNFLDSSTRTFSLF